MNQPPDPANSDRTTNALEARYHRIFRLFPASYRQEREDEMVGVLLAAAAPRQRHPSLGETAALLVLAGRSWSRLAVSPDSAANRRAADVLSVVLPLLLLFPVARTVWSALTLPWSFLVANRPDQGAWALWGLAAVAVVVGPAWLPRWPAIAGTVWFGVALSWGAATGRSDIVVNGFGYFLVQLTACCLLVDPRRVRQGRRLLRPYWWLIAATLAAIFVVVAAPYSLVLAGVYVPLVVATVLILAVTTIGLCTPTGRAMITVGGTLFAAFVAGHGWWTGVGSVGVLLPMSNRPEWATMLWLLALPALTWTVLRSASALIARRRPARRSLTDSE